MLHCKNILSYVPTTLQFIMALLFKVLEHQQIVIANAELAVVPAAELEGMGRTLLTLFVAFHVRMNELIRSWKQQRKDVSIYIRGFAGGLYAGWFEEVGVLLLVMNMFTQNSRDCQTQSQQPNNALDRLTKMASDDDEDESEPEKPDDVRHVC
jgi:hypothetical protein